MIWFLIIGMIAGWIAGLIMQGKGFGLIGNMIVGVLGALVGGYLFDLLDISTGSGFWGSLGTSVVGAVVFLFLIRLFKRI
ncbi:GlsB/YeaQ/YmgE family stress response membrane protein [Balneolaceae bacterium ANBcel3]|nr:GlsB/YeaQ/YmgE family stress response membrane protein [Balneolaceae bacterium ANBcel3]